ncbi:MAG: hypothetical protein V2J24_23015 [Pseudomonadales bacterium]|jgi:protein ImuB|nr:hypothetical protein [Pseudomonadales bacterium]
MASDSDRQLWLCLHLPRLGLEIVTRSRSDGAADRPVVLVEAREVLQVNGAGRARGLRPGMSLSTAESICADLAIAFRDPAREAATLERLAAWAYRFTPRVSLDAPDALLLELAGSLRLFRGLDRLQQRILEELTALGYSAIPGIAPTPRAAKALATSGRTFDAARLAAELDFEGRGDDALRQAWTDAVARAARPALAHMPLAFLDRPATEREKLEAMGLRTLGELLRLPRAPLGRRFGAALVDHLDRLTGRRPDPRVTVTPPETFRSTVHFLEDLEHQAALAFPMQRLVGELEDWLRLRQVASDRLDWLLSHPRHGEQRLTVHFATPQRARSRMLEYSRLQLEREAGVLRAVASLELRVTRITELAGQDAGLFPALGEDGGVHEDPAVLVDLLRARFGAGICCALAPADDHRPEHAWAIATPRPPKTGGRRGRDAPAGVPLPRGPRPLWLLRTPRPLSQEDGLPLLRGPLQLCRGPERIDVGWWERSERALADPREAAALTAEEWGAVEGMGAASRDEETREEKGSESISLQEESTPTPVQLSPFPPTPSRSPPPDDDPERRSDPFRAAERTLTEIAPSPATFVIAPPTPRDYWVARHGDGSHYWVFQELASGRWFLHGIFA